MLSLLRIEQIQERKNFRKKAQLKINPLTLKILSNKITSFFNKECLVCFDDPCGCKFKLTDKK